ncbi:complement component 1 Q subcomponent-binding protein, mitochondrial [Toxorhynchites rutilus septentrionalis]|uniref:complement component 1 Q subcomponent-binding protein, mitochondrial n=1 Tax=Toxorhynchites rutilus septentrionalis TaxID=329112 RepID=UPI002479AE1C|nr:complement component 1 Q subcomponent-binding protein, mitochondrial [Toxorhynchites rutilus septentrionalis]
MSTITKVMRTLPMARISSGSIGARNIGNCYYTSHAWNTRRQEHDKKRFHELIKPKFNNSFGCYSVRSIHTKGERELVEFLTEEIVAEQKSVKKTLPTDIEGFKIKLHGADVEMVKETSKERIEISFNVNHTVDAEDDGETDRSADKPEFSEMRSKPQFEVDIVKGSQTLSFTCSFLQGEAEEGEYNDVFGIDEITIFEGEWNDKVYAVAGDVLDGYLYDLLMNYLEEKGINNEFVQKLSDFSTSYEHSIYINLLEKISKFAIDKK